MNDAKATAKEVFLSALECKSPQDLVRYLDEACGGDAAIRGRVEELLRAQRDAGSFLGGRWTSATEELAIAESPGTVIGPYKLLQQIGEGGMGVVFMAEQTEPIQRTVALKIIKPAMDTRQVIARFEAERQALALMDHPNIAKVLDAGTTDTGRPYFVMELVKGMPITKYCDDHHVTPRERLELFLPVCQAVQHAHQKGIIHRDLKPSNVMIALYDGRAVPKVIDFGVAKATGSKLTERTLFTEFGAILGTLEYMSPEQAELNQLDVDTRADIYSLGVLLYELLTGSTPLERKRLKATALHEALRVIREEEPPQPSTRLSTTEGLPSIAASRGLEPAKLSGQVRGELDWIVMKALEKDRNRRYETANGFADDVQRYLDDEQVQACPPSAGYRLRKFAKRNRNVLAATVFVGVAAVVALGGIAVTIGWAVRDRAAREDEVVKDKSQRQDRVFTQLSMIFSDVERLEQSGKWKDALMAAQRVKPMLATGDPSPEMVRKANDTLANLEFVQKLEEIRARTATVWGRDSTMGYNTFTDESFGKAEKDYVAAFREIGIDVDRLEASEAAERIRARQDVASAVVPAMDDWVAVRSTLAGGDATGRLVAILSIADSDPWRKEVREALVRKDWAKLEQLAASDDADRQPAPTLCALSAALQAGTHFGNAANINLLRRAQVKYPGDYWINHRLGECLVSVLYRQDLTAEGIGFLQIARALRPKDEQVLLHLGGAYALHGHDARAVEQYRQAIDLAPNDPTAKILLGESLLKLDRCKEAIREFDVALRITPDSSSAMNELAIILLYASETGLRDPGRAMALARRSVEIDPKNSYSWTALGAASNQAGNWQAAVEACLRARKFRNNIKWGGWHPANNELLLATSYWQLNQLDQPNEARRWLDDARKQFKEWPPNSEIVVRLYAGTESLIEKKVSGSALSHAQHGRWEVAASAFAREAELDPSDSLAWLRAASLQLYLGDENPINSSMLDTHQQSTGF